MQKYCWLCYSSFTDAGYLTQPVQFAWRATRPRWSLQLQRSGTRLRLGGHAQIPAISPTAPKGFGQMRPVDETRTSILKQAS